MKRTRTCLSIASAGFVLAGSPQEAQSATIVRELTVQVMGSGQFDVLFDPVDDVSDLVSISAGSVAIQEGGAMQISAILDNNSLVLLFSGETPGFFTTSSLASITGNNFTEVVSPSTVKGLRFLTTQTNVGVPAVTLPVGTQFTFTIPEPTTALLSMLGLVVLGARRKRA